ncbi:MAG TPA: hypothetical protein DCP06_05865 [Lachnospiraceae bacterium]|nr:hypothetical protein [Lachnospiraceae bacterium]
MELPDLNEMDDIIVTIEEDDGKQTECQVICMFEYDNRAYAALTPTDDDIEEAYLFGVTFEDQGDEVEFTLENIDDDELLEEVGGVFESIMAEATGDDDELPEGVTIDPVDSGSHERVISDGDDAFWDQFINKKLDDL